MDLSQINLVKRLDNLEDIEKNQDYNGFYTWV